MIESDTISLSTRLPPTSNATPIASLSVPLSLPAILRGPKVRNSTQPRASSTTGGSTKDGEKGSGNVVGLGGKRRIRRWENAQFHGNPHLTRPTLSDYSPSPLPPLTTSFTPPPPSTLFPRSLKLPPSCPTSSHPPSSQAGQYALSLKGVRKTLLRLTGNTRGQGGRVEEVIEIVEKTLRAWVDGPGLAGDYHTMRAGGGGERIIAPTLVDPPPPSSTLYGGGSTPLDDLPDLPSTRKRHSPVAPPLQLPAIVELSRTPSIILWSIPDPFTRWIVHVISRWYGLISGSLSMGSRRITRIGRINLLRPLIVGRGVGIATNGGGGIGMGLDTPPTTDLSGTDRGQSTSEEEGISEFEEIDSNISESGDDDSVWDELENVDRTILAESEEDDEANASSITLHGIGHEFDNGTDDELSTTDDETSSHLGDSILSLDDLSLRPASTPVVLPWTTPSSSPITSSTISQSPPQQARLGRPRTSLPLSSRRRSAAAPVDDSDTTSDSGASRSRSPPPPPVVLGSPGPIGKGWEMPRESFADFLWGREERD